MHHDRCLTLNFFGVTRSSRGRLSELRKLKVERHSANDAGVSEDMIRYIVVTAYGGSVAVLPQHYPHAPNVFEVRPSCHAQPVGVYYSLRDFHVPSDSSKCHERLRRRLIKTTSVPQMGLDGYRREKIEVATWSCTRSESQGFG